MLICMYDKQLVVFFNGHDCGTVIICKHTTLLSGQINDFYLYHSIYICSYSKFSACDTQMTAYLV